MRDINRFIRSHSTVFSILSLIRRSKNKEAVLADNTNLIPFELDVKENSKADSINALFDGLDQYKDYVSVFLHGSWVDDSTTPFSDIDDFVIINFEKANNDGVLPSISKILSKIDMEFCRIDPLQHHGHWGCFSEDLVHYDDSYMPVSVVRNSFRILGNSKFVGNIDKTRSLLGLRRNIYVTCDNIERLFDLLIRNKINTYDLKCLVGSFALMPAFIFQTIGNDLDKKSSIQKADLIFSRDALFCIEWATDCRKNWGLITESYKFRMFARLTNFFRDPFLWRLFSRKFSPRVNSSNLFNLSINSLKRKHVDCFVSESKRYV
ncbi:hypothetical protein [Lunatimonas salinarum]|uniref:hypothetical protein n=1 Tax=Lunatimonas salinarum TaxID=1774590 RepID=UPI001ADF8F4C|nr:hypothetical protein [Lunatimonas salinarum]